MIEQPYMNELEKSQTASSTYTCMSSRQTLQKIKSMLHTHLIMSSVDVDAGRFVRSFSRIS
jgi:hypothetical protein